jgi:hypothetical protein
MKSPYYFIVEPKDGKRYANEKNIGGIDVLVSSSEEDHKHSNREAIVVSTPLGYSGPIKEGDLLLVHHNVFKFYNDMKGQRRSGRSFMFDNTFFVDDEQFFLYKRDGIWYPHHKYSFVKPIPAENSLLISGSPNEPLKGEMVYPNEYLSSKGIKSGDIVCYTPDSEYEFYVDGELMYRVIDQFITMSL